MAEEDDMDRMTLGELAAWLKAWNATVNLHFLCGSDCYPRHDIYLHLPPCADRTAAAAELRAAITALSVYGVEYPTPIAATESTGNIAARSLPSESGWCAVVMVPFRADAPKEVTL